MSVRTLKLNSSGFIDPRFPFYERFLSVQTDGLFSIKSESGLEMVLRPSKTEENFIRDGEEVEIWMGTSGYFQAALVRDLESSQIEADRLRAEKEENLRQKRNKKRDQANLVNNRLHSQLPFRWRAAMKDVLSGLSESSWGDGRNKRTVDHIYVLEQFSNGRFTRAKDDYLCTGADRGKDWSSQSESISVDGDGASYESEITCKQCLRLAEKIIARCLGDGDAKKV